MKKIEAVVHPSRLGTVRTELARRGISGEITLTDVRHGDTHEPVAAASNQSANQFEERVKLELIVPDRQADKAVSVVLRHAMTRNDDSSGQVALFEVSEVLRITDSALPQEQSVRESRETP
jgi:nitrogen regulatory protein PII